VGHDMALIVFLTLTKLAGIKNWKLIPMLEIWFSEDIS
jgi:hypothetical protein